MEYDGGIRSARSIVVCLRDMGDGTSRLFFDDVEGSQGALKIDWKHKSFYTFSPAFDNEQLDEMSLDDDWYERIGVLLAARLLAHSKRVRPFDGEDRG